jgi:hypothetical protein
MANKTFIITDQFQFLKYYVMKKRILTGLILGLCAGIIDVIPMIVRHITWEANLSALSMWIVIGFFMAITQFSIKGMGKGLLLSFCILLPNLFIISWQNPLSLIPVISMTAILGCLIGLLFQKIIKE